MTLRQAREVGRAPCVAGLTNPMHFEAALGLDPSGWEVVALCALVALALGGLITGGFVLLWRAERRARRLTGRVGPASWQLGLLALWRLERGLRDGSAARPSAAAAASRANLMEPFP